MRASTAAFALPRSGGAVTRTLSVSPPNQPSTRLRDDPGTTLTWSLMETPRVTTKYGRATNTAPTKNRSHALEMK